jgi:hypothetical protein
MEWEKSKLGIYYTSMIDDVSFYRIMHNTLGSGYNLAELMENRPYYSTKQLGVFNTVELAKERAAKREVNKLKRRK